MIRVVSHQLVSRVSGQLQCSYRALSCQARMIESPVHLMCLACYPLACLFLGPSCPHLMPMP